MKVENRTFIISGGSSGLGLATAQHLLAFDAYVSILDLVPPQPFSSPDTLKRGDAEKRRFMFVQMDITNVEQVQEAVDRTVAWSKETGAELGGVINSAGIGKTEFMINPEGKIHSLELWDETLAVNLTGTFNLTRLALEHLTRVKPEGSDGERGVVIMVASEVAYGGRMAQVAYAASKGAVCSMTLPLARDLARHNIRVVTISPATFTTPLTDTFSKRVHKGLLDTGVLFPRRYGTPEEFAGTVKWVLDCPYVNGEVIRLTGGGRIPTRL